MGSFNFAIDLPVRSEWANIDLLRTSILNCFAAMFHKLDCCETLAMVTAELLENAVKYGFWSGDERAFRLRVWGEETRAFVSVENPVRPDDSGVEELTRTIRWIESFPSAEAAYRAKLLDVANSEPSAIRSQLGLVRIAYEGNCRLRADVSGGHLRTTAEIPL